MNPIEEDLIRRSKRQAAIELYQAYIEQLDNESAAKDLSQQEGNMSGRSISVDSTAVVPYDPTLPHVAIKTFLEAVTDKAFKDAMALARYETEYLNPETPLEEIPLKHRRLCQVLPPLTGPHLIGRSSLILDVPDSKNRGSNDKIEVEIIAPTRNVKGNRTLMEMLPVYYRVIKSMRSDYTEDPLSIQQSQTLHTQSLDQLDPVESMPILIFSHGMGVESAIYRPLVEELASHGFIVLNLNHPASSNHATFSKEALDGDAWDKLRSSSLEEEDKVAEEMSAKGTANIQFVVEQIRNENIAKLPKGCGRTNKIILAGHSLGGASSVEAVTNQIAGCINLDGRLARKEEKRSAKMEAPVLILRTEYGETERDKETIREFEDLSKNSARSTLKIIEGVKHNDFTMYPILDWLVGGTHLKEGLKAHTEATQEMLKFMKAIGK